MKKLISILLISSLAIGMAGCQGSTQETAEQETITEEVVEEEPEEEVVEETVEEPESISLGEQVEVNTEYGDFLLTVDNVRKCDWVERIGNEADKYVAILVECDIENISYEDPYNDAFWIDQFLTSTDDDGYVVSALGYGYDDGLYSASTTLEIPVGSKGRIFVAYNCGIDIQSLTININGQYVLETQIEEENSAEIQESGQTDQEKIKMITDILGMPVNADGGIEVDPDILAFFNDAELFGYDGTVEAQDDSSKITIVHWISNDEYGDSDKYTDIINNLKDIYGECTFENEDYEGILKNAYIWLDELDDCDMVACGLNALDDNDQVAIYWFYDTSEYESDTDDKLGDSGENGSSEYGLDQLVGYNSLVELPEGSPVTVSGVAKEVALGIYVMEIFTEDAKNIGNSNMEQKSIYILDTEQTQSYDNRYISVNGHTDLSNNMPSVIAETITDESESYIEAGGTLPE